MEYILLQGYRYLFLNAKYFSQFFKAMTMRTMSLSFSIVNALFSIKTIWMAEKFFVFLVCICFSLTQLNAIHILDHDMVAINELLCMKNVGAQIAMDIS